MGILKRLRNNSPLIHCITNPISMMQCANACLGLGAKPIMAEHPFEVAEITASASALLLNLGNITDQRMSAMASSYKAALHRGIPVVIDAVGVACSSLRRDYFFKLMNIRQRALIEEEDPLGEKNFLLIKGNYSEIYALCESTYKSLGVDSDKSLDLRDVEEAAAKLADKFRACVLASGKTDIVADAEEIMEIDGGVPMMGNITGTGCMLGCVCATFLSEKKDKEAALLACKAFDMAGERAFEKVRNKDGELNCRTGAFESENVGIGSYLCALLDEISFLTDDDLRN